jgi:hypothetical protein
MEIHLIYSHELFPTVPVWIPELDRAFERCDEIEYEKLLVALPVKVRDA